MKPTLHEDDGAAFVALFWLAWSTFIDDDDEFDEVGGVTWWEIVFCQHESIPILQKDEGLGRGGSSVSLC